MQYANLYLHTDGEPFEVVRVISDKTMEIRAMTATRDPSWKPDIIPGGFAGHCVNQNEQRWLYASNPDAPIVRLRKVKPTHANRLMQWKSKYGHHRLSDTPRKFHDYNF